jgi:hypothetical protein
MGVRRIEVCLGLVCSWPRHIIYNANDQLSKYVSFLEKWIFHHIQVMLLFSRMMMADYMICSHS